MYYVDNQKYDLMKLKPTVGESLNHRKLSSWETTILMAWEEILVATKGSNKVRFRCPHIGQLTKHQGGSFPRSVTVQDESGTHTIVWCNNAIPQPNGGFDFRPTDYKYEKSTFELDVTRDIEEILWHICFSPLKKQKVTVKEGNSSKDLPKLFMVNLEKEADDYLVEAGRSGAAIFYLTQSVQHVNNDDFLNAMASMYEIARPETLSNPVKRQKILQMVTAADARKDQEKDSSFFIKCVQDFEEGDTYTNMCVLVQKAFDRRLIGFDQQSSKVYLLGANGVRMDTWMTVPTSDHPRWRRALARWLIGRQDKVDILEVSIDDKPITMREPRKFYLPEPLTEDYFRLKQDDGGMNWADMKALVGILPGIELATMSSLKRPEAAKILISYFIKEGKTIAPELIKAEP